MKPKKLTSLLTALLLLGLGSSAVAQSGGLDVKVRSVGLHAGIYSPSFDYFDRTIWDFSSGAVFGAEAEVSLTPVLGIKAGLGYYSTSSSEHRGMQTQTETLEYRIIPLSLGVLARFDAGPVSLFLSPGIDFMNISTSYDAPSGSQSSSGSATTYHAAAGVEKTFGRYAVELHGKYIFGSFDQEVQFFQDGPVGVEEVSLEGLNFGITLKYLF